MAFPRHVIMWMPGNERVRAELLRRIELLCPSRKQWADVDVPAHVFSKEWLEANVTTFSNDVLREEARKTLEQYAGSAKLHEPQHRKVLKEVEARLAAIEVYNAKKK